jgi:hypothetical protein
VCGLDPFCCTDKWDSLCVQKAAGECDCGCSVCQPDCTGKECGNDGCFGLCGLCAAGYECVADKAAGTAKCVKECIPSCKGIECGMDKCGVKNCGTCPAGFLCNDYQKCVPKPCEPDCAGKECGSDGCGGSCGKCEEEKSCVEGTCQEVQCVPQCEGKQCGDDGCGAQCGYCPPQTMCSKGMCVEVCYPKCEGKECGNDGCGGICGECGPGLSCKETEGFAKCTPPCFPNCMNINGTPRQCGNDGCCGKCGTCPNDAPFCNEQADYTCTPTCTPMCMGKECGSDGCGNQCGQCPAGWLCQSGMCVHQCQAQCLVPPGFMSYKQCGWDECPSAGGQCMGQGVCGTCPPGFTCGPGYVCIENTCSCEGKKCGIPNPGCLSCGSCLEGEICDPATFTCIPCQPSCTGKQCGDDGCGGFCGSGLEDTKGCPIGFECDPLSFTCVPCQPKCINSDGSAKFCGGDTCGGQCGQCAPTQECQEQENGDAKCVDCQPTCLQVPDSLLAAQCGPNNCPKGCLEQGFAPCQSTADCPPGQQCNAVTGLCVACGSCGTCSGGFKCDVSLSDGDGAYTCDPCVPNCAGKECGDNGCGGLCGQCPVGLDCVEGICEEKCNSALCFGKECGPADCPTGCLGKGDEKCKGFGECPEGTKCDPNSNNCVTCKINCGDCPEGWYCAAGNICQENPCAGKECGGECGECEEGFECDSGKCVSTAIPDVVEQAEVITPDVQVQDVPQEDNAEPVCPYPMTLVNGVCKCPVGKIDVGGKCQCPPGSKEYYGKCQAVEEESDGGGGGCGACGASTGPTTLVSFLLFAAALALLGHRPRRARSVKKG